jgi:hypothetical protein
MEVFEKIFGSTARVKLMKLFLFSPADVLTRAEVASRARVSQREAQRELRLLRRVGVIKERVTVREGDGARKRRLPGYVLNPEFSHAPAFRDLFLSVSVDRRAVAKRISRQGKVQLIVAAGLFQNDEEGRLDLLVVGDDLKDRGLKMTIADLEAEIGRQLRYAIFPTADFRYRMGMCDRLVRDVFDYPHEVLLDRQGLAAA